MSNVFLHLSIEVQKELKITSIGATLRATLVYPLKVRVAWLMVS